ncbi:pirin-like protein [Burkholderia lata]|uniref:Pirin-like protein n=1 Tax=Burkholderia lata (strain ATCC 17760 / DSM 23089 / LMG 22485 / NCIMB 9086 / R18194 / 383) TaxID=482957 RepID=A0A6P2HL42_BURL3|nr:pirin family protein [Burkholderia lata]VWB17526.1 pirin-like protein [Burkholderia lata]
MSASIKTLLTPRESDIGNLVVRRVLPARAARLVGPFIFFDEMGPAVLPAGRGIDVLPHPHIGLATVTYLFDGSLMHHDSLGFRQKIVPGDVNWMTAGRGIVHSERSPDEDRPHDQPVHGIQTWVALPVEHEDAAPAFVHHAADTLPSFTRDGASVRVIAGTAFGLASPVAVFSPTLYAYAEFAAGGTLALDAEHEERGVYLVDGDLAIDGSPLAPATMAVLEPGATVALASANGARVMLLGGAHLPGERFIEWNFVSSERAKIDAARAAWADQTFGKVPGEENEWTRQPERKAQ